MSKELYLNQSKEPKPLVKILGFISRTFVGLLFTFSGFVKAIDPLGTKYKLIDYFHAFGMDFMAPYALALSFLLNGLEFLIGISLLFNVKTKLCSWGALLFMIVFTPLTLYLALANPVSDCGCFGDAFIMTNWQTFWKNVIILVFVLILFFLNDQIKPWFKKTAEWGVVTLLIVFTFGFQYYNLQHLPILDFRPYKEGTYIPDGMKMPEGAKPDKYIYEYTLTNSKSGQVKEMDSDQYMESGIWEDTTWQITEASDPILAEKGYTPPIHDLDIFSNQEQEISGFPPGTNVLDTLLNEDRYSFWLISYSLEYADKQAMKHANEVAKYCQKNDIGFYCLTASTGDWVEKMRKETDAVFPFFTADDITLKTIVRANPGYVLLKKGTIIKKWHHNDIPPTEKLSEYIKNP